MTDEERDNEGAEEPIEDLAAPATAQDDVAGGAGCYPPNSCVLNSRAFGRCEGTTCIETDVRCDPDAGSDLVIVRAM